uniref:Uncharacterized protein n=1 Tax=Arundo donax TaxID=35708 RepID=A0A0A8ZSJ8_ARUDO
MHWSYRCAYSTILFIHSVSWMFYFTYDIICHTGER